MHKVYVGVNAEFSPEGIMVPLSFVWDNGRRYEVDRLLHVCEAPSLKAGGCGTRYTIRVRGKEAYLWFDFCEKRWFMEGK